MNLIDDGMIHEVIQAGGITKAISRRLVQYYQIAADMGADAILNTCSSVGEVVAIGRRLVDVPIIRIDEPMAEEAVRRFDAIGVLGTVNTTLKPTVRLLRNKAEEAGKTISVVEGLAEGAYIALIDGNSEEHDRLLLETANRIAGTVDGIVLAQASMSRMQDALMSRIGKDVLSSPLLALKETKKTISRNSAGGD